MLFNFNPETQHKTEISARRPFSGSKFSGSYKKWIKLNDKGIKSKHFAIYDLWTTSFVLSNVFYVKWYFCVKISFLFQNCIFMSKLYFRDKMIFLFQNDIFVSKWCLCLSTVFFFLTQKCSFVPKRHFL